MADTTLKMVLVGEDKSASKTLKGVGDEAEKSTKKLSGLGTVMGGTLAADFAAGATRSVIDFGKQSMDSFRDAEAAQRKLEDAYKRYPALADTNIEKMRELNQAIQDKTGADADDLAAAQASLAQYGLTGEQIAQLTPLLDDYATKTGKDLPSAANDLGKSMLGQGRALKDVGVDFKDAGSVAGNFNQVMDGLKKNVGGFAEGEASTADGKLKKLQTSFGDVQEEVGSKLLPILTQLLTVGLQVITWAQSNSDILIPLAGVIATLVAGIKLWTIAQGALNFVMAANPIGLVVLAIAALVAGLVLAYQRSETFRNVVNAAFDAVGAAARWLWNEGVAPMIRFVLNAFATVTDMYAKMLRGLSKVPGFGWAADAADAMESAADKARRLKDNIQDIPPKKDVTVTTTYRTVGTAPKGANVAVATGGYITGPGTGTSDSIPAWLSNGEYVIRAAAVRSLGLDKLDHINSTGRMPRYATGGLVGTGSSILPGPSGPMQIVGTLDLGDGLTGRIVGVVQDMAADNARRGAYE